MDKYRHRIMRSPALTRLSALAAPVALGLLLVVPLSGPSPVKWLTMTNVQVVHDHASSLPPTHPMIRVVTITRTVTSPSHFATSTGENAAPPVLRSAAVATTHSGNLDATFHVATLTLTTPGSFTLSTSANVSAQLQCANGTSVVTTHVVSDGSCTLTLTDLTSDGGTWVLTPDTTK